MEVNTECKKRTTEPSRGGPPLKRPLIHNNNGNDKNLDLDTRVCMEKKILLSLEGLNDKHIIDLHNLQNIINEVEFSETFIKFVTGLTVPLAENYDLTEKISGDKETFDIEVKGLLRELGCPYLDFINGDGLKTIKGRLLLLDFLVSEVQTLHINSNDNKSDIQLMEIDDDVNDCPISSSLAKISKVLKVPLVANITELFNSFENQLKKLLSSSSTELNEPLLQKELSSEQWEKALKINDALCKEYKMRREVLIKRVDVTVQSFSWSERTEVMAKDISSIYNKIRSKLTADSVTSIVDVLAARKNLCIIEKTCHGEARKATTCQLNKHLMSGKIPDRGGRPSEVPPPPDMPKFQQRKSDSGGRGGFRGRGGNYGGGRGGGGGYHSSNSGRYGVGGHRGGSYNSHKRW